MNIGFLEERRYLPLPIGDTAPSVDEGSDAGAVVNDGLSSTGRLAIGQVGTSLLHTLTSEQQPLKPFVLQTNHW